MQDTDLEFVQQLRVAAAAGPTPREEVIRALERRIGSAVDRFSPGAREAAEALLVQLRDERSRFIPGPLGLSAQ